MILLNAKRLRPACQSLKPQAMAGRLNASKGFTVLYAVLVSALLLSIGVSIYNISLKQYVLASSAVDSQIAIYAADGGIECALYWDIQNQDSTGTAGEVFGSPNNDVNGRYINCNDDQIWVNTTRIDDQVISTFRSNFNGVENGPNPTCLPGDVCLDLQCAEVTVTKERILDANGVPTTDVKTIVVSRGYNYCSSNARRVERALRISYPIDPDSGVPL